MKTIPEIMEQYKAGEITLEEANAALKEQEAGFSLKPLTEDEAEAKKQREDEEGFFKPEDRGLEPKRKITLARPDMKRRKELAGQVVRQYTKQGMYDVHYNEDGYATKAVRVNG